MQPLRGVVVAAVEQAVAAPICTRHLGDLGARVIKVENRAGGDFARDYDDVVRGMSAYFAWANRNKESVALDLKHPVGREALARLVRRADVVVQNLAPGAAARLGLDPAELRAAHPELITVDISGFGPGDRAELDAVIGEWAAGLSLAECRKAAEAAGLGHARLNRPTEVLSHPQLAERARWQEIGSPVGPVLGLLPPPESSDWDWRLDPIPALGEHTELVLQELGFSTEDLAVMRAKGVISQAAGTGKQELDMSRSSPKRTLLSRLLRRLGTPPPPPRRYFSKSWNYDPQHRAAAGRGDVGRHRGPGPAARRVTPGAGRSRC